MSQLISETQTSREALEQEHKANIERLKENQENEMNTLTEESQKVGHHNCCEIVNTNLLRHFLEINLRFVSRRFFVSFPVYTIHKTARKRHDYFCNGYCMVILILVICFGYLHYASVIFQFN